MIGPTADLLCQIPLLPVLDPILATAHNLSVHNVSLQLPSSDMHVSTMYVRTLISHKVKDSEEDEHGRQHLLKK